MDKKNQQVAPLHQLVFHQPLQHHSVNVYLQQLDQYLLPTKYNLIAIAIDQTAACQLLLKLL